MRQSIKSYLYYACIAWCVVTALLAGVGMFHVIRFAFPVPDPPLSSGDEHVQIRFGTDGLTLATDVVYATFFDTEHIGSVGSLPQVAPRFGGLGVTVVFGENLMFGSGLQLRGSQYSIYTVKESHHGIEVFTIWALVPGLLGSVLCRRRSIRSQEYSITG